MSQTSRRLRSSISSTSSSGSARGSRSRVRISDVVRFVEHADASSSTWTLPGSDNPPPTRSNRREAGASGSEFAEDEEEKHTLPPPPPPEIQPAERGSTRQSLIPSPPPSSAAISSSSTGSTTLRAFLQQEIFGSQLLMDSVFMSMFGEHGRRPIPPPTHLWARAFPPSIPNVHDSGPSLIRRSAIRTRRTYTATNSSATKRKRKAPRLTAKPRKRKRVEDTDTDVEVVIESTVESSSAPPVCPLTAAEIAGCFTDSNDRTRFLKLFTDYHALGGSCLTQSYVSAASTASSELVVDIDQVRTLEVELDWLSMAAEVVEQATHSLLPALSAFFEVQSHCEVIDLSLAAHSEGSRANTRSLSPILIDLTEADGDGDDEPPEESISPSPITHVATVSTANVLDACTSLSAAPAPSSPQPLSDSQLVSNSVAFLLFVQFLDGCKDFQSAFFASLSLVRCSATVAQSLVAHFVRMGPGHIADVIVRVQCVLSESLESAASITDTVVGAVQILALIDEADSLRRTTLGAALVSDPSSLISNTVNERVDLIEDEHFHHQQQTSQLTGAARFRPSQFTFFEHSRFLLTMESKQKVLRARLERQFVPETVEELRMEHEHDHEHLGIDVRFNPHLVIHLTRHRLVRDFLNALTRHKAGTDGVRALIKPLRVAFHGEEGIDAGGLKRETLELCCKELFRPEYGMFAVDSDSNYSFFQQHCASHDSSAEMLAEYELLGNVLALAILNNVTLDLTLAPVVYQKLLNQSVGYADLKESFPQLHASLGNIRDYAGDDLQSAMDLTFTVESSQFGVTRLHPLKPGGGSIPVTPSNKFEYVSLYADWLLNAGVQPMFDAFRRGFWALLPAAAVLGHLTASDLQRLLCGEKELDFLQLEKVTRYSGWSNSMDAFASGASLLKPRVPAVRHLWTVLHSLSIADKRAFLQFVTGSSSVPVGGLKSVQLQINYGGEDISMLPSAKTCFATLVLPSYKTKHQLRSKLMIALQHAIGFGNK